MIRFGIPLIGLPVVSLMPQRFARESSYMDKWSDVDNIILDNGGNLLLDDGGAILLDD